MGTQSYLSMPRLPTIKLRRDKKKVRRRGLVFYGYLSVVLSLLIATAALIWLIYVYAPAGFYLPVSFLALVLVGTIAYVILSRRILT